MQERSEVKGNLPFAGKWVEGEVIVLSEISPTEKDKYHMLSLIHIIWIFFKRHESRRRLFRKKRASGRGKE
jgi:hypothetical protein